MVSSRKAHHPGALRDSAFICLDSPKILDRGFPTPPGPGWLLSGVAWSSERRRSRLAPPRGLHSLAWPSAKRTRCPKANGRFSVLAFLYLPLLMHTHRANSQYPINSSMTTCARAIVQAPPTHPHAHSHRAHVCFPASSQGKRASRRTSSRFSPPGNPFTGNLFELLVPRARAREERPRLPLNQSV